VELLRRRLGLRPGAVEDNIGQAIAGRLRQRGEQLGQYLAAVFAGDSQSEQELSRLLESLMLGHTHFFRHENVWNWLEDGLRQELPSGPVRALSAGCSTGEETYTLAILLARLYGASQVSVVGADLNERSLEFARRGLYPQDDAARLPDAWLGRFFQAEGDGFLRVVGSLRERVEFKWCNLRAGLPDGPFHVVLLRNVLTYMDDSATDDLLGELESLLAEPGLVVVAAHEVFLVSSRLAVTPVRPGLPIFSLLEGKEPMSVDPEQPREGAGEEEQTSETDREYAPGFRGRLGEQSAETGGVPEERRTTLVAPGPVLWKDSPEWELFDEALKAVLREPPPRLLLDLSSIKKCDNHVQRKLAATLKLLEAHGTRVEVSRCDTLL